MNADLSIKADLARVLSTDMPVITTLFQCFPKGIIQPLRQVDRDTYACTNTNFKPDWYKGATVKGRGLRVCDHSV